ncbi:MAG: NADH-dependent [FeFe] hydrogenase, group A6 [Armatimonadota bacterium]
MSEITLTVDGMQVSVPAGATVMQAADKAGIRVPRLCYHPRLSMEGACRVCLVDVEGQRNLVASCCFPAAEGMVVKTHTPEVLQIRRDIVELLLDNHPKDCNSCERDGNCELQRLAYAMGIRERLFEGERKHYAKDNTGPAIIRDPDKCILCGRCVRVCGEIQEVAALAQVGRGFKTVVMPAHDAPSAETVCVGCGQCVNVCPTAAFLEMDGTAAFLKAVEDPEMIVVGQMAPSVRAAIGEAFGQEPGQCMEGEIFAAMRRTGFDYVFDTQFAADLTIMEEGAEFVKKFTEGNLPNITSCCPTWVKFAEQFHPDMLQYLSTAKSPMSMQGAVVKTYWAEKMGIDPSKIYSVAIMCCTCKKNEAVRPELFVNGMPAVDTVLTTREFAWVIKHMGIDFLHLQPEEADHPLGESTGAAVIFGATGGVTEAALRSAYFMITGEDLPAEAVKFEAVRTLTGVREATINIKGIDVNIAVVSGLANTNEVLDKLRSGEKKYHWIEVMGCPGGCIGGGGQPYAGANAIPLDESLLQARSAALYNLDEARVIRCSHHNPDIQKLYTEYFGEPLSHKSHELLHTYYYPRLPLGVRPQEAQI